MNIRPAATEDLEAIQQLVREAFLSAPPTRVPSGTEQFIVRDLSLAGALAVSLVAVVKGKIVGHVAVSPVSISDGSPEWYGLGPVAVVPSHRARGIGSRLVREALRRLNDQGAAGCVVLGEPAYYGRFGFRAEPALLLEGVPPGYFQAISFGGAAACGRVTYHPAFSAAS